MNIKEILSQIDNLLHECRLDDAEIYMQSTLSQALEQNKKDIAVTILNELIGFYRDCGKFEKSLECCEQSEKLLNSMGISENSSEYISALLNKANIYRASSMLDDAYSCYDNILELLNKSSADVSLYASYYNNLSLLHQEANRWNDACTCLENALEIVESQSKNDVRVAISRSNLAVCYLKVGDINKAEETLKPAMDIFRGLSPSDFHYSATLSAMGDILYAKQDYKKSAEYYEMALSEIELHMGKNNYYDIVLENLNHAYKKSGGKPKLNGISLCRKYFNAFGKPMLERNFPDIINNISCGLIGEGSECLGFDDEISTDHDFGTAFCIWVDNQTFDLYGEKLKKAYDLLPKTFMGYKRLITPYATTRTGVIKIEDFLKKFTGYTHVPNTIEEWLTTDDSMLIQATSGSIFLDNSCIMQDIQTRLLEQPLQVRLKKLAQQLGLMAQSGQYNYPRMLKRNDIVSSQIALTDFIQSTMRTVHILNDKYAPYSKWLYKSMQNLSKDKEISKDILKLSIGAENSQEIIERICSKVCDMLKENLFTDGENTYLGTQAELVSEFANRVDIAEKIILLEWKSFDKVQNVGGRANCQDDWDTFSKMRRSQYYTWTMPLLKAVLNDFQIAIAEGRNPITEKYAYMMKSTSPKEYAEISEFLPEISKQKHDIIEAIVPIQVSWIETFAEKYPNLSKQIRNIHTYDDTLYQTSYETYLRGELSTYSEDTIAIYGQFIVSLYRNNENLAKNIMERSINFYGYTSLDEAEKSYSK